MSYEQKFEKWMKAAYRYYETFDSEMDDVEWDMLGRELSENWDKWDHPDKKLVRKDDMYSAYHLTYNFPEWAKL